MEKQITIAVRKNESGQITDVLDVHTVFVADARAKKQEANSYRSKKEQAQLEQEQNTLNESAKTKSRVSTLSKLVAKCLFNDLVDRGYAHTTEEFEKAFANFVLNGIPYDSELEPLGFKKVLQGVDVL